MAALCLHAHHNISVTDKACAWNQKKPIVSEEVQKIGDLYKPKRSGYMAVGRQATSSKVAEFKSSLGRAYPVGFTWYLMSEPSAKINTIPDIEKIIFSEEYTMSIDKDTFLTKNVK